VEISEANRAAAGGVKCELFESYTMGKTKKTKNRSKGNVKKQGDALFIFEKRMEVVLRKIIGKDVPMHLLNKREREHMRLLVQHVKAPRRYGNSIVSKEELKNVNILYQRLSREENIELDDKKVSLFDLNVYSVYIFFIHNVVEDEQRKKKLCEFPGTGYDFKSLELLFRAHNEVVLIKLISALTDVSQKIFCVTLKKERPYVSDYILEVSAFLPIIKNISINGNRRSIYKVGLPSNANVHKWAKVDVSLLKDHYSGEKKALDVYIQAHALKRMGERLDGMGAFSRNFMLAITFPHLKFLEPYKGYLLIPIEPAGVRVGYLFCNVIDEMLVIRTFLFITHSATPEGDRLKKFTGLNRSDISYWKIDRLSTLFKIDEEHWPELLRLFELVGIKNIQDLNVEVFNENKGNEVGEFDSFVGCLNEMKINFLDS
tara:strand:- start:6121 stop:7410 length:1290 start_codon:yes stop_codon:yes gene_type:complete